MTTIASLGAAAARATLEDHRRLRAMIESLERLLAPRPPRGGIEAWRERLAPALETLRDALELHFAAEEGQLFPDLEAAVPNVSSTLLKLAAQHRSLRADLSRLCADVRRSPAGMRAANAWTGRANRILVALQAHEQRENALIFEVLEPAEAAQD